MNDTTILLDPSTHSAAWFNAQYAYDQIKQNYNPQLEIIIAKSAYWSYYYAQDFLKSPFPLGEPIIASSIYAIDYAKNILQSRFKLAENTPNQLLYIKYILKFNHE